MRHPGVRACGGLPGPVEGGRQGRKGSSSGPGRQRSRGVLPGCRGPEAALAGRGTTCRFEGGWGAAPVSRRRDISAGFRGDHRALVSWSEEGAETLGSGRLRGAIPILLLGLSQCQTSGRAGGEIWKQRAACSLLPAGPRGRCRARPFHSSAICRLARPHRCFGTCCLGCSYLATFFALAWTLETLGLFLGRLHVLLLKLYILVKTAQFLMFWGSLKVGHADPCPTSDLCPVDWALPTEQGICSLRGLFPW